MNQSPRAVSFPGNGRKPTRSGFLRTAPPMGTYSVHAEAQFLGCSFRLGVETKDQSALSNSGTNPTLEASSPCLGGNRISGCCQPPDDTENP